MEWQPVDGYEGEYQVNRNSDIRRIDGRIISQHINSQGYYVVRLSRPRAMIKVHRIVAKAFIPNPMNLPVVNHIDSDKENNRVENLEWCTQKQNIQHAHSLGRMCTDYWAGKRSPNASLTDEEADAIRNMYSAGGVTYAELAEKFYTNKRTVGNIINGKSYLASE